MPLGQDPTLKKMRITRRYPARRREEYERVRAEIEKFEAELDAREPSKG